MNESSDGDVGNGLLGEVEDDEIIGEDICSNGEDVGSKGDPIARIGELTGDSVGRIGCMGEFVIGRFGDDERSGESGEVGAK